MEFHGLKGSKKNWGGLRSSYNPKLAITIKVLEHLKKYLKLMPLFKLFVVPFLISPHPFSVCGIPIASLSPLPNRQVLLCSPHHSQNNYCIIYALSSLWPHLTVHPHASGCSRVPLVIKDSAFLLSGLQPRSLQKEAGRQRTSVRTASVLCVWAFSFRGHCRILWKLSTRGEGDLPFCLIMVLQNQVHSSTHLKMRKRKKKKGTHWGSQKGIHCCNWCLPCSTGCWGGSGYYNPKGEMLAWNRKMELLLLSTSSVQDAGHTWKCLHKHSPEVSV